MSEKKEISIEVRIIRVEASHLSNYRFGWEYYACLAGFHTAGLKGTDRFNEEDYINVRSHEVFEKQLPLVIQQYIDHCPSSYWFAERLVKRDILISDPNHVEFTVAYKSGS